MENMQPEKLEKERKITISKNLKIFAIVWAVLMIIVIVITYVFSRSKEAVENGTAQTGEFTDDSYTSFLPEDSNQDFQGEANLAETVIDNFIKALQKGSLAEVQNFISPQIEAENMGNLNTIIEGDNSLLGKNFEYKVNSTFIENPETVARVTVEVLLNDQPSYHTFILTREDKRTQWLIHNYESFDVQRYSRE